MSEFEDANGNLVKPSEAIKKGIKIVRMDGMTAKQLKMQEKLDYLDKQEFEEREDDIMNCQED